MRTIVLVLLIVTGMNLRSQEYVASIFNLSKLARDTVSVMMKGSGVISLDENNNHFLVTVPLYPVLDAVNENDSIRRVNRSIILEFDGIFPVSNLSVYDIEDDRNLYSSQGTLTINNISRPYRLDFELHKLPSTEVDPRDLYGFPARISFTMEINPAHFHLDLETARFTEYIRVTTASGLINRLDPHANRPVPKKLRSFRDWARGLGDKTKGMRFGLKNGLKNFNVFDGIGLSSGDAETMARREEEE